MRTALLVGSIYVGVIYALGFLLGALRELLLTPRFGPFWPRLMEIPFMLAASWLAAAAIVRRQGLGIGAPRVAMGATALMLLLAAEAVTAMSFMGRSLSAHLASYATAQGVITLAAQLAFAAFPLFVRTARTSQT
jgi:hypothetical protein